MEDALAPTHRRVPEKPTVDGLEERWVARWDKEHIYRFNADATRESVFSIDTPPPTVSGTLHIGHVFSYTHPDIVARFWRMRGKDVFYPMGWDDNGLPTERRVENYYGVRCDPSLPYDPKYRPPEKAAKDKVAISRKNFVELCVELTARDEQAFKELWRAIGVSVDWNYEYSTISKEAQAISQRAFLEMLAREEVYSAEAPTLWDIDFRTAVSQAELEDRERPGAYHRVAFDRADNTGTVDVDTTRPELLRQLRRARRAPRRRALPTALRHVGRHAALRRRGADPRPRTGRPRKGHRHRHDLHLRRHDRRRVVARTEPPDEGADRSRRSLPASRFRRRELAGARRRTRPGTLRPRSSGQDGQPGARGRRRRAACDRRADRRRARDHAPRQVLREEASARSRS